MNAAGWPAAHPEAGSRSPGSFRGGLKGRMRAALVITIAVLAVEIAGGIASHSLALIADAAHLFADLASLALAYAEAHPEYAFIGPRILEGPSADRHRQSEVRRGRWLEPTSPRRRPSRRFRFTGPR